MVSRFALLVTLLASATASAERPAGVCVGVEVELTPSEALQIVAWVEDGAGNYVDTVYITNKTGRYGMGNRPGRADFNTSSPTNDTFPYGRRVQTFPVWAHRHGIAFPLVVFQNGDENDLSHPVEDSSPERPPPYSKPFLPEEAGFDAGTSASAETDKGTFAPGESSKYPPRSDLMRTPNKDSTDVDLFRANNPFDAISKATPPGGIRATASWAAPQRLDFGNYVLFVETSKTYDFNGTYNETTFPAPSNIPWRDYGKPWRGQPSIVYRVPFTMADTATVASTTSYAGYGDPTGAVGTLNPPDATITTDTPGSGAARLQLIADGTDMYRVRVRATPEFDSTPPDRVASPAPITVRSTSATVSFVASGDDGMTGKVTGYEIRVRASSPMTAANFTSSMPVTAVVIPDAAGTEQTVELTGLLPETEYYVGIRPFDNCFNHGELAVTSFVTLQREVAEVDWCFIATAAYGSPMANDVHMLRRFRDRLLTSTVLGELAVETYYTFGPAVAGVVGESDLLRASARAVLAPLVAWARQLRF